MYNLAESRRAMRFEMALAGGGARKIGLAVLSGLCLTLIFPFFDVEMLAWIAFVPLFYAIQDAPFKTAFGLGWLTGVIHFFGTLYWVTVTMVEYGGLTPLLSGAALALMVVYLAIYPGLFCLLLRLFERHARLPFVIIAPVLWVGLEYLRSFFLIAFPWNLLGYSQFRTPSVTQIADLTGVYGVSFLIVLVNAGLFTIVFSCRPRRFKIMTAMLALGALGVTIGYSRVQLQGAAETTVNTVKIAAVQGNIDQKIKWDQAYRQQIFDKYLDLSRQMLNAKPDLILWPETAVPFLFRYDPAFHRQLTTSVQSWQTALLFGGLDLIRDEFVPKGYDSLNSAFFLSADGEFAGQYAKIQLVPFGEYVPFRKLLFFIDRITTAIGEVRPGEDYTVMYLGETPFSAVICFEIIFPDLVRKFVDSGAGFLVTITNDAWFGKTAASYQHFAMVTFRAIENRIAIARAANTGISGFIDPYGRILAQSDIFVDATLTHEIPLRTTKTWFTRHGDLFARACFWLTCLTVGYHTYSWYRQRMKTPPAEGKSRCLTVR